MMTGAPSSVSVISDKDWCPRCGDFGVIDEVTGWCVDCAGLVNNGSTGVSPVIRKQERALAVHADAIEHYMVNGKATTVWEALRLARQDRAICVVCGEEMAHASRNAVFCRRYAECRRYSRRYVYLYTERKRRHSAALGLLFSELA